MSILADLQSWLQDREITSVFPKTGIGFNAGNWVHAKSFEGQKKQKQGDITKCVDPSIRKTVDDTTIPATAPTSRL